jgi:intracellular multiplication protein IcmO
MHGSGFIFVDGKADNKLYAEVLALARRFGREDDVLALNFLVASGNKDTNTFNPFAWGNADGIRELLVSLIEANAKGGSSNGNEVFMSRAVSLLGALTPALVWLRDNKGFAIEVERLRFATELGSIAALALEKRFLRLDVDTGQVENIDVSDIEPALLYPLSAYLNETSGYDKSLAHNKQKTDEPAKQHSFVTMHFSAVFTQLGMSLGHIFKCEAGDIDMRDVVLNRRILVVNLPALENSGETTAALGKIVVASLRNMMAQTLGVNLEGDFDEVIANKPSLAPTTFPVVFDEITYYAVGGMDKMLAMGRGLGFMFYLGFQELPGLKARIGEAAYSLLGNANLQILMKLQEGSETRQYVERTAGESEVTQQTSYTATDSGGYRDAQHAQHAEVRRVSRVDWKDLRGLIEGEAIVLFGNRRVHAKLFYAKIDPRGRLRLNRPLVLRPPAVDAIERAAARTANQPPADRERRAAGAEPGGHRAGAGSRLGGLPERAGGEEVRRRLRGRGHRRRRRTALRSCSYPGRACAVDALSDAGTTHPGCPRHCLRSDDGNGKQRRVGQEGRCSAGSAAGGRRHGCAGPADQGGGARGPVQGRGAAWRHARPGRT